MFAQIFYAMFTFLLSLTVLFKVPANLLSVVEVAE